MEKSNVRGGHKRRVYCIKDERRDVMKTSVSGFKSYSAVLLSVYLAAVVFVCCGCMLQRFSELERRSLENGVIALGAARVTDYDEFAESRDFLIKVLEDQRKKVKEMKANEMVPQSYVDEQRRFYWAAAVSMGLQDLSGLSAGNPQVQQKSKQEGKQEGKQEDKQKDKQKGSQEESKELLKKIQSLAPSPRPSTIEILQLRMAALKFIESEIEELSLAKVCPVDESQYRRVVVSIDMTAWVASDAKAALVYLDLYPYRADTWCRKAKEVLEGIVGEPDKMRWDATLRELKGFEPAFLEGLELPTVSVEERDCVAVCHWWLRKNKLRPRIVQVERMNPGEYSVLSQGDYSSGELQAGFSGVGNVGGGFKIGGSKKKESVSARVRPLNLAFVAGYARAGWLFMPSSAEQGRMRPTERRLRMVVDIPKKMEKLSVHAHKIFLDGELQVVGDADFAHQMQNLKEVRRELGESDVFWEHFGREERHYRLIKTRIRNLLHQGWSDETVIEIPPGK